VPFHAAQARFEAEYPRSDCCNVYLYVPCTHVVSGTLHNLSSLHQYVLYYTRLVMVMFLNGHLVRSSFALTHDQFGACQAQVSSCEEFCGHIHVRRSWYVEADGHIMNLHDHVMHFQRSMKGQLLSLFEHTVTYGSTNLLATRF
jgi:hypothetical protein